MESSKAGLRRTRIRTTGPTEAALVMIADDNEDARDVFEHYLVLQGYRIVTALDGVDAVQRAHTCQPDIILMDLQMPRLDGWEAIRQLKTDPRTASILLVAISAYAHDAVRSEARAAGADASLTKPCLPAQVSMMVRALLSWRDGKHSPKGQIAIPAADPLGRQRTSTSSPSQRKLDL